MIKYRTTYCCATAFILLTATVSYSQKFYQNNYWLGVGAGKSQYPSGMMALGYEFTNKPTLIIARYVANGEVFSDTWPGINVSETGLLYGFKTGKFRFSSGLSYVWGRNRGRFLGVDPDPLLYGTQIHESIRYETIGVPAEIRFITSTKDVGIGLTGFGNWNARRSFVGLNLSLYVGQMK